MIPSIRCVNAAYWAPGSEFNWDDPSDVLSVLADRVLLKSPPPVPPSPPVDCPNKLDWVGWDWVAVLAPKIDAVKGCCAVVEPKREPVG